MIQLLEGRQLLSAYLPDLNFAEGGVISGSTDRADLVLFQGNQQFVSFANQTSFRKIQVSRRLEGGGLDLRFASDLNEMRLGTTVSAGTVLADDKLMVALGSYTSKNSAQIALLNSDGERSTDFATNGIVTISFPSPVTGATITGSKIVSLGQSASNYYALAHVSISTTSSIAQQASVLVRIKSNGLIDSTFGKSGFKTLAIASSAVKVNPVMSTDSADRLVALVYSDSTPQLHRYSTAGAPDTTFASAGRLNVSNISIVKQPSLTIQNNNSILIGTNSSSQSALYRYSPDGSLDTTFGNNGKVELRINNNTNNGDVDLAATVQTLQVLDNGKIAAIDGSAMFRLNEDGSADTSFDTDGQAYVPYSSQPAIDGVGRLVVYGELRYAARAVATLTPNGVLYIQGDDLDNNINVRLIRSTVRISSGNVYDFPAKSITRITTDMLKGNDVLTISYDKPHAIHLGDGNDQVFCSSMNVTVHGGTGNDTIVTGTGNDYILPEAGNDSVDSGDGIDTILDGIDSTVTDSDNDFVNAGTGNDLIKLAFGNNTIWAGDGDDSIRTGEGNDSIFAGLGKDTIRTAGGNDTLDGGGGRDQLIAGNGNDLLIGGSHDDVLIAGPGKDSIYGNSGNDLIIAYDTQDTLSDIIDPGSGIDTLYGDNLDAPSNAETLLRQPFTA